MADKPCTHCGGSGKEPDPMTLAHEALVRMIAELAGEVTPGMRDKLQDAAYDLRQAMQAEREQHQARIAVLEAVLRDALGQFSEPYQGTTQLLRVPNADLRRWRVVLDGTTEPTCPGEC